jgi:hypothetical protein
MKRLRVLVTLFLVAGFPIALVVWVFVHEIRDLSAWGRINPLGGVADTLMDQVETQIHDGHEQIHILASDPDLAGPAAAEALGRYDPYVRSGRFKALFVALSDGRRYSLPAALPAGWEGLVPGPPEAGLSELAADPDGALVVAITAPVTDARGWVTGLLDVSAVLGESVLDRMRIAEMGQAFLVDREGHIFLSADRALVGHSLVDLGLARGAGAGRVYEAGDWRTEGGEPHYVALAPSHGYYEGPQNGWRAGLMVPESVVAERSEGMAGWVAAVVVAVFVITAGLVLVLRHSMKGAPRT